MQLLGEDMCVVIDKRPESDAAIASDGDDAWMGLDKDVLFTFFVTSGSTASPKLLGLRNVWDMRAFRRVVSFEMSG